MLRSKILKHITAATIAFAVLIQGNTAQADIIWAGTPIVDLRTVGDASAGSSTWTNHAPSIDLGSGLLAGGVGDFSIIGAPSAGPVGFAGGTNGVQFDGLLDAYQSQANAPSVLTGLDPTRSIEVWAFNPSIAGEETLLAFGKRGGGAGQNMSFNYGNHGAWGATGHWGGQDLGWDDAGGAPVAGEWHHLVYSYDGSTTRVYADGVLANSEFLGAGAINTHANTKITLAAQLAADGFTVDGPNRGSLALGAIRVHDGVLSDTDILNNYNEESANYIAVPPPTPELNPLGGGPIHRYSFNDEGSNTLTDSIGGAHGSIAQSTVGGLVTQTGGRLDLPGGTSDVAGYGDLPNGIVSSLTDLTVESWVTVDTVQTWSRIFDFGTNTAGEQNGPGGAFTGVDYFILTANIGNSLDQRVEFNGLIDVNLADSPGTTVLGQEAHLVVTFDDDTNEAKYYINGQLISTAITNNQLNTINDVNNWLGRSNWAGDRNLDGSYDEVRIYDRALTNNQVLGNFVAGPNDLNVIPEPTSFALLGLAALGLVSRKRRNQ